MWPLPSIQVPMEKFLQYRGCWRLKSVYFYWSLFQQKELADESVKKWANFLRLDEIHKLCYWSVGNCDLSEAVQSLQFPAITETELPQGRTKQLSQMNWACIDLDCQRYGTDLS